MFTLRSASLALVAIVAVSLFSQSAHAIIPPKNGKPTTIAKRFFVDYVCFQTHSRQFGPLQFFQALQLKSELQNLGFQTQLSGNGNGLVVYYRLSSVRSKFFTSLGSAQAFESRMQWLGCQTQIRAVSAVPW